MVFEKAFQSNAPIVLGNTKAVKAMFPPGFRWNLGGIIYTVKGDVTQETASPMREVFLSDGATEIIPVESILKDMKEKDCKVMDPDPRFDFKKIAEREEEAKKKKKKTKKKVKKSKTKKKIKKG